MNKKILFVFTVIVLSLAYGCAGGPDPVQVVLDMMIREYGGRENLSKLDSHVSIWDLEAVARGDRGESKTYVALPDKLRVEIAYPEKSETRVLNGDKGYKSFDGSPPSAASGPGLGAMKLQLMRLYSPLHLKKISREKKIELVRTEDLRILVLKEGPLTVEYHMVPGVLRIIKTVGKLDVNGREMEFVTELSDFKEVDGVLVHQKEVKYAAGINTAVLTLKEFRANEKIDPKVFD